MVTKVIHQPNPSAKNDTGIYEHAAHPGMSHTDWEKTPAGRVHVQKFGGEPKAYADQHGRETSKAKFDLAAKQKEIATRNSNRIGTSDGSMVSGKPRAIPGAGVRANAASKTMSAGSGTVNDESIA